MDLNRVFLIGNLTQDPRIANTPTGKTVASFSVATNRQWISSDGVKQNDAEFHNIVAWGRLAEIVGQYMQKGKKVFIEGRLQTRDWKAQDGSTRRTTEVVASEIIMLSSGGGGNYNDSSPQNNFQSNQGNQNQGSYQNPDENEISIDDIPL